MGGEKHRQGTAPRAGPGSPPRGRGKGIKPCYHRVAMGITPAWAGKSCQSAAESAPGWDHPRVGGEKRLECFKETARQGSPPRGRGKGGISGDCFFLPRITPAWAGKRLIKHLVQQLHGDHPRVGGEKVGLRREAGTLEGSPPRGRGKALVSTYPRKNKRITPAWAGKRRPLSGPCAAQWDHPRVGGEKGGHDAGEGLVHGSPPRGRGKARTAYGRPAGAMDHPRVGGEKTKKIP